MVGLEHDIGHGLAAHVVTRQIGVNAHIVVENLRYLPFRDSTVDRFLSYSVIQHFNKEGADVTF